MAGSRGRGCVIGVGSSESSGRRGTVCPHGGGTPSKEPGRQKQDGLKECEQRAERDACQAEWKSEKPDDWPKDQGHQGERPAKNKQDAPREQGNERLHVQSPRDPNGSPQVAARWSHRQPACDEPVESLHSACSGRMVGNRITSRIDTWLVSSMTRRSTPMPTPPVGGMPYSSARR